MTTEISILLSAKDQTKAAFSSMNRNVDEAREGIGRLQALFAGAFAGISIAGTFTKFIQETRNAEQEQAQLAAVLRSTGEAAGWSQEKLNEMAASLSRNSVFSEGDINNAQTRLLSYTGIVGEQVPKAMQAVIDMSARLGMDLNQSAETIGKALDIPSQGMTALQRQGFRFTEEQKKLAKQLEASGKTAEAQGIILQALESSYGGAAKAARDTFGGAISALQNNIDSLMTGDSGSMKQMKESVEGLNRLLESEETRSAFQTLVSWLTAASTAAIRGAGNLIAFMSAKNKLALLTGTDSYGKMQAEAGAASAQVTRLVETAERYQGFIDRGHNVDFYRQRLAKVRQQITAAQARSSAASDALKGFADETAPLPSTATAPDVKPPAGGSGGGGGSSKSKKDLEAEAKRAIESLEKQLERTRELSEVEKQLEEIRRIRAGGGIVTEEKKQEMLRLAAQIDAGKERAEREKQDEKEREARQDRENKRWEEGQRLIESTRTPLEAYNAEVARLNDLLSDGTISQQVHSDAMAKAREQYQESHDALVKLDEQVDEFSKRAAGNIQDQLGDGLYNALTGNFSDIGKAWGQMLARMVAEAAAAKLSRAMFGDLVDGGKGSGWFGSALKGIGSALGLISGAAPTGDVLTRGLDLGNAVGSAGGDALETFARATGLVKFDVGTNYVPQDMLAMVHKGEKIVPAKYNRAEDPDAQKAAAPALMFAPSINVDSRSDRAAVMADMQSMLRESFQQFSEQLKRTGVMPA